MSELVERLRSRVIDASSKPDFVHHTWYPQFHLEIVDHLAKELLAFYPAADAELVGALVWLHDYGKTISEANADELSVDAGSRLLTEIGFDRKFIDRAAAYLRLVNDSWDADLSTAPIEVQIVSTADGCSHFIGPFFHLWWWEHADQPFEALMAENRRKMIKDWTRKIVLPEARAVFEARYRLLLEQTGVFPERYLS